MRKSQRNISGKCSQNYIVQMTHTAVLANTSTFISAMDVNTFSLPCNFFIKHTFISVSIALTSCRKTLRHDILTSVRFVQYLEHNKLTIYLSKQYPINFLKRHKRWTPKNILILFRNGEEKLWQELKYQQDTNTCKPHRMQCGLFNYGR